VVAPEPESVVLTKTRKHKVTYTVNWSKVKPGTFIRVNRNGFEWVCVYHAENHFSREGVNYSSLNAFGVAHLKYLKSKGHIPPNSECTLNVWGVAKYKTPSGTWEMLDPIVRTKKHINQAVMPVEMDNEFLEFKYAGVKYMRIGIPCPNGNHLWASGDLWASNKGQKGIYIGCLQDNGSIDISVTEPEFI
jgi:hypothetical protein